MLALILGFCIGYMIMDAITGVRNETPVKKVKTNTENIILLCVVFVLLVVLIVC